MKFNHFFIPQGAKVVHDENLNLFTITYNKGTRENPIMEELKLHADSSIILDTGNALKPGIIDHHQPGCEFADKCVAHIVVNKGSSYLEHLLDKAEVNVVTHFIPDLDALGSVYFTLKYLRNEAFTFLDQQVADYINMVDMGKLSLDPEKPIGIASLWLHHTNIKDYSAAYTQEFNQDLLAKGLLFMEGVFKVIETDENPYTNEGFEQILAFEEPIKDILNDASNYRLDVENSITGIIEMYNSDTRGMDEVEVIISRDARSFLWKYMVRGDRNNSLFGNGFKLTCLHVTGKRGAIISVDPNYPYDLKGLGVYLDTLEITQLLNSEGIEEIINGVDGGPRSGFHRNNPWYDGRGTHNFTIIDVPRGGTMLSETQINDAIFAYQLWPDYGVVCNINPVAQQPISQEDLNALIALPLEKRPQISKNSENKVIHSQIDEYLSVLCKFQIDTFLTAPKLLRYDETFGTHIEALCLKPENDVFLNLDEIKTALKNIHSIAYNEYQHITKCKYWSELLSTYVANGFNFFNSRAYDKQKNEAINEISPYLNYTFIKGILNTCNSLPASAFAQLFIRVETSIKHVDLPYEMLGMQTAFPEAFSPESLQNLLQSNDNVSTTCQSILGHFAYERDDEPHFEEVPIYSFNSIKNYIDDLFHLLNVEDPELKGRINRFKKTDFKQLVPEQQGEIKANKLEILLETLSQGKHVLIEQVFGEKCKNLRVKKYQLINKVTNPHVLSCLIKLDFEQLKQQSFGTIREQIGQLEKTSQNDPILDDFIKELKLFEELASLSMLINRIDRFSSMNGVATSDDYLKALNKLLYSLLRVITLYTNFNNIDELQNELANAMGILNELRMMPMELDRFETSALREKMAVFIPVIVDEVNLPVNDLDLQIQRGMEQFELIMGQGGIMEEIFKLPLFYQQRFYDIFSGFKRYYKERLNFFRTDLKLLIEESETGNETKLSERYILTCNNLISDSVAFDWQELKDQIDELEAPGEISPLFYSKYFDWLKLNASTDKKELYALNSEIRFAEGRSDEDLNQIVVNLPNPKSNDPIRIEELVINFQLADVIKHRPINLIHDAYDFLIDHFISKYHVDNVRDTLAQFSTKFPWYYRYLTDKKYLRMLFIFLSLFMLGAGAFDGTRYKDKLAPLAEWMNQHIGGKLFQFVSELFAYAWGLIISLSFIIPLVFVLNYLYHRYILREKPDENDKEKKLNFFQLIQNIEGKRSHLLYIPFVIPLLIVVLQMSNSDTIELINKIEGFRFFATLSLVVGLTILSVYNYVKERNEKMSTAWLIKRTEHMLWLHLIQAFIIAIFVIDLILRFQVDASNFETEDGGLFFLGMSKYIEIKRGVIDVVIMPTFTIMITILTLFFSFFIEKIFGGGNE
jgi:hypothetical protein